jgi:hypothetical protein
MKDQGANLMQVVIKEPNKPAEIRQIADLELKTLQNLVGGYIEMMPIANEISVICDEEGLFKPDPQDNCGFVGTIVFVQNAEDNWAPLSDEIARKALAWCKLHQHETHPDKDGGFEIFTSEQEIAQYRAAAQEANEKAELEWKSL